MAAMLVFSFYNLLDSIWLTRLGPNFIAAYTVTFPLQMLIIALGIGTGVGAGSYVARMLGANEIDRARRTAGQGILLSLGWGITLIALIYFRPDDILALCGGCGEIVGLTRTYILTVIWGVPFHFFLNMATNLFRADGRPTEAMYVLLVFSLCGLIFDPILIFGWGPLPSFGIKGAALAAIVSQLAAAIVSAWFLFRPGSRIAPTWNHLVPHWPIIHAVYQTAFPSIILNLMFGFILIIYNHVLATYGALALGTLSICFRINGVVTMALFGIGQGVMPMIGYNVGAQLHGRTKRIVHSALIFSWAIGASSCAIIYTMPDMILSVFTSDEAFKQVAIPAVRLFALSLFFSGPTIVWINMFIGMGKGITALVLLLVRDGLLLIPAIYFFNYWYGLTGVWFAQLVSVTLGFIGIGLWARREIKLLVPCA